MSETNPYKPILEIKAGNEVLRIMKNDKGFYLVFGAETDKKSNLYEMSLTDKQRRSIISGLTEFDKPLMEK